MSGENVLQIDTEESRLTPRQREILKIVVQEYVSSASPVGSATILKLSELGVSSATIRNELVLLEDLGYLHQPHTSAGRSPTVKGYRYYVEQLMEQSELPVPEQRMITHQFHQLRLDMGQWMRLTAAVLAHTSQAASVVTAPRASSARFRHLEMISTNDRLCLLVLVLQDGSVHQEMMVTDQPVDQDTLSQTSNRLNTLLRDCTVEDIRASTNPELRDLSVWDALVLQRTVFLMRQVDHRSIREIYSDGLVHVLQQPEFDDAAKARHVISLLEQRGLLESVLAKILNAQGVQIIIGGEGDYQDLYEVSLVLSPYGVEEASGILGIIGPTRMRYGRAISTVRYVAHLMDGMLAEMYGPPR
ncbi:MAG: heat-inducible transcriptional repressor HrcA [Anaerolineae bacterium]